MLALRVTTAQLDQVDIIRALVDNSLLPTLLSVIPIIRHRFRRWFQHRTACLELAGMENDVKSVRRESFKMRTI